MTAHDSTAGVSGALTLPALSPGMVRLQALLGSRSCNLKDVSSALELDPRLSAYVLHVAHVQRERGDPLVKSIPNAVCVLGLAALGMIAMRGAAMLAFAEAKSCEGFDVGEFWRHSVLAAHVSRELAGKMAVRVNGLSADQLYACVLLHDIGQLVLLQSFGAKFAEVHGHHEPGQDITRIEDELLGYNHAKVGAQVAAAWGLPEPVPERIGMHHVRQCADDQAELSRLIACADSIAHQVATDRSRAPAEVVRAIADPPHMITSANLAEVVADAAEWYAKIDEQMLAAVPESCRRG
jgi:HD-like signal output (HDOD) protein